MQIFYTLEYSGLDNGKKFNNRMITLESEQTSEQDLVFESKPIIERMKKGLTVTQICVCYSEA